MIQQQCLDTFNNNLSYFKIQDVILYKKINEYKNLLDSGEVKPRYSLEYINKTFNLLHLESNTFFYNSDSKFDQNASDSVNFGRETNTITSISTEAISSTYIKKLKIEKENRDTIKTIRRLRKLLKGLNRYSEDKLFQTIHKFIFMGVILGTHLDSVHKKMDSKHYLIIEPDIEIFYLSMFVSKYNRFAQESTKIYSVMDNENELLSKINLFQSNDFQKNYCIKYFLASNSYSNIFETISVSLASQNSLSYTYSSYLKAVKRTRIHMKNNSNILNLNMSSNIFGNKPILVVSPGPSVEEHLPWLKKFQDRFIIVCYSQMIKRLINASIIPDIITIIDAEKVIEEHFRFDDMRIIQKCILLASTNIYPPIFSNFKPDNVFLFEKNSKLKINGLDIIGNTVGEVTYFLLLKFQAQRIYFLGTDLAVNSEGQTHEKSHTSNFLKKDLKIKVIKEVKYENKINQEQALIKVKGNFDDYVFTTFLFKRIINNYNNITKEFKAKNQIVYNLSSGAQLADTIPFSDFSEFQTYPSINKSKLYRSLKDNFAKISEHGISKIEKGFLKLEINRIYNILESEVFLDSNINNYEEFELHIKLLITKVLQHKKNNYSLMCFYICYNYFHISCNFIDYILNDKNKTYKYKSIYKLMIKQVKNILQKYQNECIKLL